MKKPALHRRWIRDQTMQKWMGGLIIPLTVSTIPRLRHKLALQRLSLPSLLIAGSVWLLQQQLHKRASKNKPETPEETED